MIERKCPCTERAAIARARARQEREEAEEEREEAAERATNGAVVSGPLGGRTGAPGCGHDHSKQGAHTHGHNHGPADAKTGEQLKGGVLFDDQMTTGDALNPFGGVSPERASMLAARRAAGCSCLGNCTCGRFRRVAAANQGNPSVLNNQKAVCTCNRRSWRA